MTPPPASRRRGPGAARAAIVAIVSIVSIASAQAAPACPAPGAWHVSRGGALVERPGREVFEAMAAQDIVLLGEQHDDATHHAWQLEVLGALHALRPDMALGFETFPRRVQPALDRWVAGTLSEAEFLKEADWDSVWRLPAELYLPLFRFARMHRLPMIALNVERSFTEAVARSGWASVPTERREGVARPAPPGAAYRATLRIVFESHEKRRAGEATQADPALDEAKFERFVEAQTLWDRAMAEALAARLAGPGRPLVVGILGTGHVQHGHGVPHQLRALGVTRIGTLLPFDVGAHCSPPAPDIADALFAVPQVPQAAPPPPRLGVSLAQADQSVRILEVVPGSLAATSGLEKGDRIARVAGRPAQRVGEVVAAIRAQPPGTVLPLGIERDGRSFEILVRFPPRE